MFTYKLFMFLYFVDYNLTSGAINGGTSSGYNILRKTKHIHLRVDHTKEFVRDFIHTNNVESFWGIFKRGIYGMYHHVSVKYLQDCVNEFCFRFNKRGGNIFDEVLKQVAI